MATPSIREFQPCLFCGGDAAARDHLQFCPGPDRDPNASPGGAFIPPPKSEPYTNPGKGTILTQESTTNQLAILFDEKPFWTSSELNDRVGWQFSQGIFSLRRRGIKIRTLKLGPRSYGYERVAS